MFESLLLLIPPRLTVLYVTPIMNVEMTILSSGRRAFIILLLFLLSLRFIPLVNHEIYLILCLVIPLLS